MRYLRGLLWLCRHENGEKGGTVFMKKIWVLCVALAAAAMLSACGVGNVGGAAPGSASSGQASSAPAVSSALSADSVGDDLAGLQKYLSSNAGFSGTPEKMEATIIGAKSGVRYVFGHDGKNNVSAELYEYDVKSLNETAQKILTAVKADGKFTLMGQQVEASLSDSGKYLMIYKNSAADDTNKAYNEKVLDLFRKFKA